MAVERPIQADRQPCQEKIVLTTSVYKYLLGKYKLVHLAAAGDGTEMGGETAKMNMANLNEFGRN